jgi:hypothetical protein
VVQGNGTGATVVVVVVVAGVTGSRTHILPTFSMQVVHRSVKRGGRPFPFPSVGGGAVPSSHFVTNATEINRKIDCIYFACKSATHLEI